MHAQTIHLSEVGKSLAVKFFFRSSFAGLSPPLSGVAAGVPAAYSPPLIIKDSFSEFAFISPLCAKRGTFYKRAAMFSSFFPPAPSFSFSFFTPIFSVLIGMQSPSRNEAWTFFHR